jgi:hypothetical protein
MRFREFFKENIPTATAPGSAPGKEAQDIGKLTATIQSLQKQVTDLQKASLQKSAELKKNPEPAGQAQTAKGTTGSSTAPGQAQPASQANPMMDMLKKMLGTQQGGATQTPSAQKTPMGQSSQVTDMKIQQQLAKTQGQGT